MQRWHGTLLGAGLSPRTVTHAHRLLSACAGVRRRERHARAQRGSDQAATGGRAAGDRDPHRRIRSRRCAPSLPGAHTARRDRRASPRHRHAARRAARAAVGRRGSRQRARSASSASVEETRAGLKAEAAKDETRPAQHHPGRQAPSPCSAPTRSSSLSFASLSVRHDRPGNAGLLHDQGRTAARATSPRRGPGVMPGKQFHSLAAHARLHAASTRAWTSSRSVVASATSRQRPAWTFTAT